MAIEDSVPELAAEKAQRLPQGPAGVRRVEVWPKQRDHGVAADTVVGVDGEIGEQGETLRLSEDRADRASVGPLQVHGSQRPHLDHARTARGRRADGGQVTLRSRLGHWPALVWPMYAWQSVPAKAFSASSRAGAFAGYPTAVPDGGSYAEAVTGIGDADRTCRFGCLQGRSG